MYDLLLDSAFLLLVGLLLAGLIHIFLNEQTLNRLFRGESKSVVLKAALIGIPLPLCSCSVLPVGLQLKKNGISKGGLTSFLISTPETGVDSILLTYSLTNPALTLARPVAAFVTAVSAGLVVNQFDKDEEEGSIESTESSSCCSCEDKPQKQHSKVYRMIDYAFNTILKDLAPYLFWGYLLAGFVAALLGDYMSAIPVYLQTGIGGYVGAVIVGLPMYICATSSTPLAAVLLSSGFSPGAILVFLLVGPATNITSMTVVLSMLRKRGFVLYLTSIIVVSIICGFLFDFIMQNFGSSFSMAASGGHQHSDSLLAIVSTIVLTCGILYFLVKKLLKF